MLGKVQRTEYTAFKLYRDFPGKLCQLPSWTPGGKLPEDGVFSNNSDCSHADEAASFKRVLQVVQSIISVTVAVNAVKDSLRAIGSNLSNAFNGDLYNSPRK